MKNWDVIIVGGGPAGLNAAVVLGRCRRKVLVIDAGRQRNRSSHGMHNFLTRDDILPARFLALAQKELKKYEVEFLNAEISSAKKQKKTFILHDQKGKTYYTKKLLIATGLQDKVPPIRNIERFYGHSVFHCPYCDGWEMKDRKLAVYAKNKNGFELALALKTWSRNISFFTDGKNYLSKEEKDVLQKHDIPVITKKISCLEGKNKQLGTIVLADDQRIQCDALFFVNGYTQQCDIAQALGCRMSSKGVVLMNRYQQTNVPGLYVAGDVAKDMHFVVVAAAEGAKAGVIINKELQKEER
jgi:thioredoxin reductase